MRNGKFQTNILILIFLELHSKIARMSSRKMHQIITNQSKFPEITLLFEEYWFRFWGKARARNGEQALEDCLRLQRVLGQDLVHSHVKKAVPLEGHCRRFSTIESAIKINKGCVIRITEGIGPIRLETLCSHTWVKILASRTSQEFNM